MFTCTDRYRGMCQAGGGERPPWPFLCCPVLRPTHRALFVLLRRLVAVCFERGVRSEEGRFLREGEEEVVAVICYL